MRDERRTGRGRPKGSLRSQSDSKLLEYLAFISLKHEVDSGRFFDKLVEAWTQQKSLLGNLLIECREKSHDRAIFLITEDGKVVTQFYVHKHLLQKDSFLRAFDFDTRLFSRLRKEDESHPRFIKDLEVGMKKVRLKAKVLKLSETRKVLTRFGSYTRLTNAIIGDTTGNIKLSLWNKQIDGVSLGDRIVIDNARVVWYRGERQLRIRKQEDIWTIDTNEDLNANKS